MVNFFLALSPLLRLQLVISRRKARGMPLAGRSHTHTHNTHTHTAHTHTHMGTHTHTLKGV